MIGFIVMMHVSIGTEHHIGQFSHTGAPMCHGIYLLQSLEICHGVNLLHSLGDIASNGRIGTKAIVGCIFKIRMCERLKDTGLLKKRLQPFK